MYAQLHSQKASSMIIGTSIISVLTHVILFRLLQYSNHLYDVGKYSSFAWLCILVAELVKHIFIERGFRLDTSAKTHNFAPPGTKMTPICPIAIRRGRWKDKAGFAKLFIQSLVFYGFICFVLGAPLEQWEETISLAFVLTTLTILPIMLFIGQSQTYQLLLSEKLELTDPLANNYLNQLKSNCFAVILGAWAGSVVAPLDWDRPWQVYSTPNIFGAIIGLSAMNVLNICTACIRTYRSRRAKLN